MPGLLRAAAIAVVCIPAQDVAGSIAGRVTDASGAVFAGAEIVATHSASGVNRRATTGCEGGYAVITGKQVRELQFGRAQFLPGSRRNMSGRAGPNINPDVSINGAHARKSNFHVDGGANFD